jgi:hypothetical protein
MKLIHNEITNRVTINVVEKRMGRHFTARLAGYATIPPNIMTVPQLYFDILTTQKGTYNRQLKFHRFNFRKAIFPVTLLMAVQFDIDSDFSKRIMFPIHIGRPIYIIH